MRHGLVLFIFAFFLHSWAIAEEGGGDHGGNGNGHTIDIEGVHTDLDLDRLYDFTNLKVQFYDRLKESSNQQFNPKSGSFGLVAAEAFLESLGVADLNFAALTYTQAQFIIETLYYNKNKTSPIYDLKDIKDLKPAEMQLELMYSDDVITRCNLTFALFSDEDDHLLAKTKEGGIYCRITFLDALAPSFLEGQFVDESNVEYFYFYRRD